MMQQAWLWYKWGGRQGREKGKKGWLNEAELEVYSVGCSGVDLELSGRTMHFSSEPHAMDIRSQNQVAGLNEHIQ